ncbi:MAG: ATP-binding protein [Vicinamibacteria bacterium]
MKPVTSLRSRLLVGSILWTTGLVAVTNAVLLGMVMHRFSAPVLHLWAMSVFAIGLLAAGLFQIHSILSPFTKLRERLGAIREGRAQRLEGKFPEEVQPLVEDLNALLDHREERVRRAVARAGDLAHGLKTPLAILGQEASRLAVKGDHEGAEIIGQQVERMRHQIDYHLAQARATAAGNVAGTRAPVKESADGLVRALTRLHAEKGLDLRVSVPADHAVRVQREDLDEMLGNLLDNACKWTRSVVLIESCAVASNIQILIEDDGLGITEEMRTPVLQRGVRADEAVPGSGFGLAIVADLAELYGGSIVIEQAPSGGVRARLTLPSASAFAE